MSIRTINNSDYKNLLISNLPTRPNASPSNFGGGGLSANQMKKAYDATPLFIIGRFNELIDYINGTGDPRLADDILNAIKGVLASKVETGIEGIATLSDLFASVKSGNLAKAIRVSDGKSLDETLKTIAEVERILAEYKADVERTLTEYKADVERTLTEYEADVERTLTEYEADVERTLTEYEAEKLAPIVSEAEILRESVSSAQSRLSRVEKKVENLGAGLRLPVIEDTDVAYTKIVPDGALPYAEVAKVGGMSYESANLLDMSKCVATTNTTIVVGEGTLTVTGYISINTLTNLVGGKDYFFKAKSTRTGEEGGGVSIECYDSNSTKLYETYRQHTLNPNFKFTVPSGTVRTKIYFYGGMQNATTSATYTDVMLSSKDLPYSPYFEGLRHAKVKEIKSESANLLDMSKCVATTNTTIVVGEGTLTVTGYISINTLTNLVGGKDYFFKAKSTRTGEEGGGVSIECYDSNSTKLYETYRQHTLNPNFKFTVPSGTVRTKIYFYGGMQNATTSATYTDVMLSSTDLPYSPYCTIDPLPIPSAVQALDGYREGVDAEYNNHIDWSEKKYYKYCGALDLSRQSFSKYSNDSGQTIWGIDFSSVADLGVCDKYAFVPTTSINSMQEGTIQNRGTVIYICDSSISSASEIKGTFIYALATPEVTDISHLLPEDNFIQVEGGGTITAVNEYGLAAPTEIIYQTEG